MKLYVHSLVEKLKRERMCLLFPCIAHGTMIAFYYVSSVCTYFACDKISFDIDIPLGKNWEISIFEAYLRYYTSLTVEKKFSSGV